MDLLPAETLANAETLTGSFAVVGSAMSCRQASSVALMLYYQPGTGATLCRYIIVGSLQDTPTVWVPLEEVLDTSAAAAGGDVVAPSSQLVRSLDAVGARSVIVDVRGYAWVAVKAAEDGGPSPFGTLTVMGRGRL